MRSFFPLFVLVLSFVLEVFLKYLVISNSLLVRDTKKNL